MLSYQVGEIDENGFVCIGIEERKMPKKSSNHGNELMPGQGLNRSMLVGGHGGGNRL